MYRMMYRYLNNTIILIILFTEQLEADMQVLMCRRCTLIVSLGNGKIH